MFHRVYLDPTTFVEAVVSVSMCVCVQVVHREASPSAAGGASDVCLSSAAASERAHIKVGVACFSQGHHQVGLRL